MKTISFDQSNLMQDTIKNEWDCPGFTGHDIRFRKTTNCAQIVMMSFEKCKIAAPNVRPLVLCADTCKAFVESINAMMANNTICNQAPEVIKKRQDAFKKSALFCESVYNDTRSSDPKLCFPTTKFEASNCGVFILIIGFLTKEEKDNYCAIKNENCCLSNKLTNLNPPNSTWIVSIIIVSSLLLIGLIIFILYRRNMIKMTRQKFPNINRTTIEISKPNETFMMNEYVSNSIITISRSDYSDYDTLLFNKHKTHLVQNMSKFFVIFPFETIEELNSETKNIIEIQAVEEYEAKRDDEIDCMVGDIFVIIEAFDNGKNTVN
jgi:hypothetical protein